MTAAEQQLETFVSQAHALGIEAGKTAASWVTDGDASSEHYARLQRMMDDGDPELEFALPPRPNLSGEWADAPNPRSLFEEVTGLDAHAEATWNHEAYSTVLEAICSAWEEGASETFEVECERLVRAALADEHEDGN